jgi:hypothetical protein
MGRPRDHRVVLFATWLTARNCIPLAAELALQARLLQVPVALSMDLRPSAHEHVLRRDVTNGTVQAYVVVVLDVTMSQALRIV